MFKSFLLLALFSIPLKAEVNQPLFHGGCVMTGVGLSMTFYPILTKRMKTDMHVPMKSYPLPRFDGDLDGIGVMRQDLEGWFSVNKLAGKEPQYKVAFDKVPASWKKASKGQTIYFNLKADPTDSPQNQARKVTAKVAKFWNKGGVRGNVTVFDTVKVITRNSWLRFWGGIGMLGAGTCLILKSFIS